VQVFYSGHSLMDQPIPNYVESIAKAAGAAHTWDRQYRIGSSLRERTRGTASDGSAWTGWTSGDNRRGSGMDVAAALSGRIPNVAAFDTLLTTERHDILWVMTNEDSASYLRRLHDLRMQGQPAGSTWFYEGWQSFDASRISDWVAYERASAVAWQCVAAEANRSLESTGRVDRVFSLPASRALVNLVEQALAPKGLVGVTAGTPVETLKRIFSDDVHLTELGKYYMALVIWSFANGKAPEAMTWRPPSVTEEQAHSLLEVAAASYDRLRDQTLVAASASECQQALRTLCPTYWGYIEQRRRAQGASWAAASYERIREQWRCGRAIDAGRHQVRQALLQSAAPS
jgi:hypothetical protein